MNERGPIDVLHGSTCHGEPPTHPDLLLRFTALDPTNRPAPLKRYRGVDPVLLPRDLVRSSPPAVEVLSGTRVEASAVDDGLLGTLLFLTAGVTRVARGADKEPIWLRAAMSAGNLHPIEVYVVRRGVHHYQPLEHALAPLRPDLEAIDDGSALLVLTGIAFRTCWKYGERGWRHLWWDAGTMLANLLAAADAHGVPAEVITAFSDAEVAALVGVDGTDEAPLAVVRLGTGEARLPPAGALEPVAVAADPVAPRILRFPMVVDAHGASSLPASGTADWRAAAASAAEPAPPAVVGVDDADPDDRVEDVVLRRGSTRVFRRQQASRALLEWALPAACRAVPFDVTSTGTFLQHLVNVHAVVDAEPGGYRFSAADGFEGRTRIDDPRQAGRRLCLDQPLGGDSVYTSFHAARLGPLLDALGARGYRLAQLEAGIAAGRLALNAVALHAGATGLTFFDGLVSRYFGTDAAPMLATAVGLPATVPAPSGEPGRPAELRGYGRVMARLSEQLRQS